MMNIVNAVGNIPRAFFIAFLVVSIDQLSKLFARTYLTHTVNTGTVLGLFPDSNFWFILLTLFFILFFIFQYDELVRFSLPFGFIIGGAIGNVIDRISLGGVVDFIRIGFFPSFNVADSALTLGIAFLLYSLLKEKIKKLKK